VQHFRIPGSRAVDACQRRAVTLIGPAPHGAASQEWGKDRLKIVVTRSAFGRAQDALCGVSLSKSPQRTRHSMRWPKQKPTCTYLSGHKSQNVCLWQHEVDVLRCRLLVRS
jgi:hypothetical protein